MENALGYTVAQAGSCGECDGDLFVSSTMKWVDLRISECYRRSNVGCNIVESAKMFAMLQEALFNETAKAAPKTLAALPRPIHGSNQGSIALVRNGIMELE